MNKPKIVILGAGYGGIITTQKLEKLLKNDEVEVTLINKHAYHYITTRLHKTGAGTIQDDKMALPIKELVNLDKINFIKGTVYSLDFNQKSILLESGETVDYDYLLVSLGFQIETFGIPGIEEHAFNLRSYRSSKALYHHIENQFAKYVEDQDSSRLTFAVAGAGFTGIEMVGELTDKLPKLAKKYHIPFEKVKIVNIEASPYLLPGFDTKATDYATELLQNKNVEVLTATKIVECTNEYVTLDTGKLSTKTLIWSCGVRGHNLFDHAGLETVRGRIPVDKFLRIPTLENVFAIGDNSIFMNNDKSTLPPTAQVALQQAPICAENIVATLRGTNLKPFVYHHKGTVASISDFYAVGKVGNFVIKGKLAAFVKQLVELKYLMCLGGPLLIAKQLLSPKSSIRNTVKEEN